MGEKAKYNIAITSMFNDTDKIQAEIMRIHKSNVLSIQKEANVNNIMQTKHSTNACYVDISKSK